MLATSVERRKFDADGNAVPTHGDYPAAMRALAEEERVALLDVQALSIALWQRLGVEETKKYFNWTATEQDNTHFNPPGAIAVARLVTAELLHRRGRRDTGTCAGWTRKSPSPGSPGRTRPRNPLPQNLRQKESRTVKTQRWHAHAMTRQATTALLVGCTALALAVTGTTAQAQARSGDLGRGTSQPVTPGLLSRHGDLRWRGGRRRARVHRHHLGRVPDPCPRTAAQPRRSSR